MSAPASLQPGDVIVTRSIVEHITDAGHIVARVSDGYLFLAPADAEFEARGEPPEPAPPSKSKRKASR